MDDRRSIGRIDLEPIARVRRRVRSLPEIRFETESIGGRGRVKNISPRGLFVLTDKIPLVEESVHVVFQDDTLVWIDLIGVVRWTRPEENESGTPGFGLEIDTAPEEYKAYVQRLASAVAGEPHRQSLKQQRR